jgi:hypothetical protein
MRSGDFVWPKKPGAYVPYRSSSQNSPELDARDWNAERDAYLNRAVQSAVNNPVIRRRIEMLRAMDYREFLAVYLGAQTPGVPGLYAGGGVYVGHVGVIEIESDGTPWVIEALLKHGVVRRKYSLWLEERVDQVVWLARLREISHERRALIATEAKQHVGKPYDFWNFDLNDDSCFYCSKLVWLSIFRALGFAVDGENSPSRSLWFSPKQLLNLPVMEKIHDPGSYATT